MSSAISSSRASGVGAVQLGGSGGSSNAAGKALGNVAANVASTITAELRLSVDPDGHKGGSAQDMYQIEAEADEMVENLGGTTADKGRAAQALHSFAQEVASLIGARPGSRALEHVHQALNRANAADTAHDVTAALRIIELATEEVAK